MSGAQVDTHAVCAICLSDLLVPLLDRSRRESETNLRQRRDTAGWVAPLAKDSGISSRRISAILAHEQVTVGLRVADELLCALDRPDLMQRLEVFLRPHSTAIGRPGEHVCGDNRKAPTCRGCGCDMDAYSDGCSTCVNRRALRACRAKSSSARHLAAVEPPTPAPAMRRDLQPEQEAA